MSDLKQFIKKTLLEFINESKNYGNLYHYTRTLDNLISILKENN